MRRIRVLIVDDSSVVRRLLSDLVGTDPALDVAGTAPDGRIALQKIELLNPDLVTLDVEMPVLDGLATLKEIRKTHPRLPVIMFSTLTSRGAAATLDAISAGASDYVCKPGGQASAGAAMDRMREDLIPRIKALCAGVLPKALIAAPPRALVRALPGVMPRLSTGPIRVVAIGCSTGGPNALTEVLPLLPADFPTPIVIVQHMPPLFTRMLAERLATKCKIKVVEAREGMKLVPGQAVLAPGDYHFEVVGDRANPIARLTQEAPENSCRPAVDVLFRSVARMWGGSSLAVVLTGMGQDGLRGCEVLRAAGGRILAQDEATSVVWGMPGFVARAGLAERVLPLPAVGSAIVECVRESGLGLRALESARP